MDPSDAARHYVLLLVPRSWRRVALAHALRLGSACARINGARVLRLCFVQWAARVLPPGRGWVLAPGPWNGACSWSLTPSTTLRYSAGNDFFRHPGPGPFFNVSSSDESS